jgi:transposase-like protein
MKRITGEAATVAATDVETFARIEIVGDRRRAHDTAFRRAVVTEAMSAGARVQDVALRHGICPSLVYLWRRMAGPAEGDDSTGRLFPVRGASSPAEAPPALASGSERPSRLPPEGYDRT